MDVNRRTITALRRPPPRPPPSSAYPPPPQAADLIIERSSVCQPKPDPSSLVFGKHFSDHMLTIEWSESGGWQAPQIKPFQNLSLHPASSALHYSIEVRSSGRLFVCPSVCLSVCRH